MKCNKKTNLKKGYNRYCSFIKNLGFKDDTVFGLYLGCPCKQHDIYYSKEGKVSRPYADYSFFMDIIEQGKKQNKQIRSYFIGFVMWFFVRLFGLFIWKTWSSKWAERYK